MKKYIWNLKRVLSTSIAYFTTDNNSNSNKISNTYFKPSELYEENGIEYGRNFGRFKCLNCNRIWTSAYTWISTDFCFKNKHMFKDKTGKEWYVGKKLKSKDFILEYCESCTSDNNTNVIITSYNNLRASDNDNRLEHHYSSCVKCKKGFPCQNWNK